MKDSLSYLKQTAQESIAIKERFLEECGDLLVQAAEKLGECVRRGGKVLLFGNGGSAADAQHMAGEMVGRMLVDREALPAIALTTDTSNITAIANDFSYDDIFSRQVQSLANKGDLIIAISTSGNSKNILEGVKAAKQKGCYVIGLTGGTGGKLKEVSDLCLNASLGKNSSRIQETHIFAIHSIVDLHDRFFLKK